MSQICPIGALTTMLFALINTIPHHKSRIIKPPKRTSPIADNSIKLCWCWSQCAKRSTNLKCFHSHNMKKSKVINQCTFPLHFTSVLYNYTVSVHSTTFTLAFSFNITFSYWKKEKRKLELGQLYCFLQDNIL